MDDVAKFAILGGLPIDFFLGFRLFFLLHAVLLAQILLGHREVRATQEASLRLGVVAVFSLLVAIIVLSLLRLQEITQEHLIEVVIVVNVCIGHLMEILSTSAKDSISVSLGPSLFNQTILTLSIIHKRVDLFDDCRVED